MEIINKKHIRIFIGMITLFVVGIVYSYFSLSAFVPSPEDLCKALGNIPADARYIVMVDFGKSSAQERLFVYDLQEKEYIYSGVVQHGLGGNSTMRKPEFSNEVGSKCSSLGMYRVAENSRIYGIDIVNIPCFRLDGLSSTNSNARVRGILIHPSLSTTLLPFEVWGMSLPLTPESMGCFAVSMHTMRKLSELKAKGGVYLYAYCNE